LPLAGPREIASFDVGEVGPREIASFDDVGAGVRVLSHRDRGALTARGGDEVSLPEGSTHVERGGDG
jgi:hypothetical protein